jgi:hypothetical protein
MQHPAANAVPLCPHLDGLGHSRYKAGKIARQAKLIASV